MLLNQPTHRLKAGLDQHASGAESQRSVTKSTPVFSFVQSVDRAISTLKKTLRKNNHVFSLILIQSLFIKDQLASTDPFKAGSPFLQ